MDPKSVDIYKKMGFTHFVVVLSSDPRLPDGYKAVKAGDRQGVFVDENGFEYTKAEVMPAGTQPTARTARKRPA